jgi:DNA-binding MarR family transcriptional regulator
MIVPQAADPGDVARVLMSSIGLVVRTARRFKSDGDVSLPELLALKRLERAGSATSAALAKYEQISPQSMSATLGALEARGFIERRPDPQDRRQSVVSLSAAGQNFLRDGRTKRTELMAQALAANFTPQEFEQLLAIGPLLERLARYL